MTGLRRIALIARLSPGYIEGVIRGVGQRARPDWPWLFELVEPDPVKVRSLCRQGVDGAVVVSATRSIGAALTSAGVPVVNTGPRQYAPDSPHVGNDDPAIGRLAAQHLLDRGFKSFAYVGHVARGTAYPELRGKGFSETVQAARHLLASRSSPGDAKHLGEWLQTQPKPLGVLAANDAVAWRVVEACRSVGLRVPEEAAVLGVDDDQTLCHLAYPSLSSVRVASRRIGAVAAEILDHMMSRGMSHAQQVAIPPIGIAVRRSTDIFAVSDPVVADALRLIERRATADLSVAAIADHLSISRRTLEQRFRRLLNRSPREEIERVRLTLAREMLVDTTLPLSEIARLCGFGAGKRLSTVFRKVFGAPPSSLRRAACEE